jgi:hypothetical protein
MNDLPMFHIALPVKGIVKEYMEGIHQGLGDKSSTLKRLPLTLWSFGMSHEYGVHELLELTGQMILEVQDNLDGHICVTV